MDEILLSAEAKEGEKRACLDQQTSSLPHLQGYKYCLNFSEDTHYYDYFMHEETKVENCSERERILSIHF